MKRFVLSVLGAVALLSQTANAQSIAPGTTWKNELNSVLTITTVGADGSLIGTYVNQKPPYCVGTAYPVVGWVDDNAIGFTVRWTNNTEDCNSITSWTGYLVGSKIMAHWDLVFLSNDEGGRQVITRGTDFFEKQ